MAVVNGTPEFFDSKEAEFADLQVRIAGVRLISLQGLMCGISQEKEYLHGEGDNVIGIQRGNRVPKGKINIFKVALDQLNRAAIAAGGRDVLDLEFDIVAAWRAASDGTRPLNIYTLVKCQITEYEIGVMQGDKKVPVELPIMFKNLAIT
ncbi:MAG: hypothetical protein H0X33_14470 [Taibaiella sp.]|nr:hypothetical protein [Taibaiella sp.]